MKNAREYYTQCFKSEKPTFVKVMQAVPADQAHYKPHPRSSSAGDILWLLATELDDACTLIDRGEVNYVVRPFSSVAESVAAYEKHAAALEERLPTVDDAKWDSKAHFYGAAALAMRRILVERARAKGAQKRGGSRKRLDIDEIDLATADDTVDWLSLDEAMTELQKHDGALHEVVMLRFFAGLSVEETAEAIDKSDRTVKRDWTKARTLLYQFLHELA